MYHGNTLGGKLATRKILTLFSKHVQERERMQSRPGLESSNYTNMRFLEGKGDS
jgi:hypothetical protein